MCINLTPLHNHVPSPSGRGLGRGRAPDYDEDMKFWVNTVSRSHVERGVEGGFTQANHGSASNLKRLAKSDRIVFYAPRTDYPGASRCRSSWR